MTYRTSILVIVLVLSALILPAEAMAGKKTRNVRQTPVKIVKIVKPSPVKLNRLPVEHVEVIVRSQPYFCHAGVWYRSEATGYIKVTAPIGARLKVLPAPHTVVMIRGVRYYLAADTYYRFDAEVEEYYVAEPPESEPCDTLVLSDGERLTGQFLGGDKQTVDFQVDDLIYQVDRNDIVSILLAPENK